MHTCMYVCVLPLAGRMRTISFCSYSEIRDEIKFMHACMYVCVLPLAGRMPILCNLRLLCLPYERENDFSVKYISHLILTLY